MSIFEKYDLIEVDETFPIPNIPQEGLTLIVGSSGSGDGHGSGSGEFTGEDENISKTP